MVETNADSTSSETRDEELPVSAPTDFSDLRRAEQDGSLMKSPEGANLTSTNPNETPKTARPAQELPDSSTQNGTLQPLNNRKRRLQPSDEGPPTKKPGNNAEKKPKRSTGPPSGAATPLADHFNDGANSNCSTSVDVIRKCVVGDNKVYPLTIQMEQRMIIMFLQNVFAFTDVSSAAVSFLL